MNPLASVLQRMGRRATTLLPFSLLLGLLFQDVAAATRPLLLPLAVVLLMLVLALLNLIAVPLVVWPIWQSLGLWPGLITALCLSAMAPGIISAATTASFLRLDASLALLISLITNFLVPFTLPPLALWLLGFDLKIGFFDLSLRLGVIVALALAGAIVIRRWLGPRIAEAGPTLDGVSVVVLMVFAIPLMDGVVARALSEPVKLAGFIVGAFGGMILCNLVMAIATLPFLDRRSALTVGYCSGGRHNALLMAVLPVSADPDIFLFIAAVQFPLYMMPLLLQPLYRRLLPR